MLIPVISDLSQQSEQNRELCEKVSERPAGPNVLLKRWRGRGKKK